MINPPSRMQFAQWSFERDRAVGCFAPAPQIRTFSCLSDEERQVYLEEADFYLAKPADAWLDEWPEDILERLTAPGI